jgi:CHAT domain-containing protein
MLRTILLVALSIYCLSLNAQDKTKEFKDYSYSILEEQFKQMMHTRGDPGIHHYLNVLKDYESQSVSTDQGFANLIREFYPYATKTGFILYTHHNDSLRRVFLKPGVVLEQKTIPITKAELSELHNKLLGNLNIRSLVSDRAPSLRGVAVSKKREKTNQNELANVIKEATELLIPDAFDENFEHLVIIPALNIGSFPFHLLQPYKDNSYLIDKCSFVMAPSMIDFIALKLKVKKDYNGVVEDSVIFTFDRPLFVSNPAYPLNTKFHFPDLPGTKNEIANTLPFAQNYTLLEGSEATKEQVIKNLKRCDIAYFATHGIASETMPMDSSFLVLSGEQDPFLTAREIMELKEKDNLDNYSSFPEMVILSACQTGLGRVMESGITGLSRAFIMAGSRSVIMSLWNVDDNATAYLMNRFSFHLQQPHMYSPAGPLRLAILDTKKKYPNPMQWASFSTFGVTF